MKAHIAIIVVFISLCAVAVGYSVMRIDARESRERQEAFDWGYRTGLCGQPAELLPYGQGWGERSDLRISWISGWQHGDLERKGTTIKTEK